MQQQPVLDAARLRVADELVLAVDDLEPGLFAVLIHSCRLDELFHLMPLPDHSEEQEELVGVDPVQPGVIVPARAFRDRIRGRIRPDDDVGAALPGVGAEHTDIAGAFLPHVDQQADDDAGGDVQDGRGVSGVTHDKEVIRRLVDRQDATALVEGFDRDECVVFVSGIVGLERLAYLLDAGDRQAPQIELCSAAVIHQVIDALSGITSRKTVVDLEPAEVGLDRAGDRQQVLELLLALLDGLPLLRPGRCHQTDRHQPG